MIARLKLASRKILKTEFARSTFILTSGTVIAQGISLVTAPVLTHIYHPDYYGLLGLFMLISGLGGALSTFQYHNAIVTAPDNDEAELAVTITGIIGICVALLSLLAILLFSLPIARILGSEQIRNWLYLVPLSILFTGISNGLYAFAVRNKEFKAIAVIRLTTAFVTPAFSITAGLLTASPMGLIVGLVLGQGIPAMVLFIRYVTGKRLTIRKERQALIGIVKKHKNFAKYSLPSEFINNFSNQIPILMLSHTAGTAAVGFFNLSNRMLGLPAQLLSTSVGEVFRQKAAQDFHQTGTCRPVFMKVFKTLLKLAIFPFAVIMLLGPQLFGFFFGERWAEAGQFSQILGILFMFKFVVSPLTYVTYIANKQWIGLISDIVLLSTVLLIFFAAKWFNLPYMVSLIIYSVSYSALYFITFYLSYRFTNNKSYAVKT
ncbi:MAG: oligosaccharide flippase family protein [Pseudobacter sp.]|uniref:oligosaccharide flippase family protein n=1 Tax=Pseudobacter sp. TaxID=2045420 RepID=UPI003F7DA18E